MKRRAFITLLGGAAAALLFLFENGRFRLAAHLSIPTALIEFYEQRGPFEPTPGHALQNLVRTKEVIVIDDASAPGAMSNTGRLAGARSFIAVPMLKEKELIGAISIYRQEVRPFTDKQIELVTNFATVLTTIVAKAVQLSSTDAGAIYAFDETKEEFQLRATYGMDDALIAAIKDRHIGLGDADIGEAAQRREPVLGTVSLRADRAHGQERHSSFRQMMTAGRPVA